MRNIQRLCSLVSVACSMLKVSAQVQTFQWGWNVDGVNTTLQECQTLPVIPVSLNGSYGVPPYYMIAFEVGGVPTTTNLGSSNMYWQNTHKKGSKLMITVVDSNTSTSAGPGVAGVVGIYNVVAGSDTSCLPSHPSTIPSINSNVTDTLSTCDEWGLTVSGGKKPYTIVLSAGGSPVITNISIPANDNTLTWPNRADPNVQLMASVVDGTGQWGVSSSIVSTTGSANVTCGHLLPLFSSQQASPASSSSHTKLQLDLKLELGLGIGVGVLVLLGFGAVLSFCIRRGSHHMQGVWDSQPEKAPSSPDPDNLSLRAADAASRVTTLPTFRHLEYSTPGGLVSTPFMQVEPRGYYPGLGQPSFPPMSTVGSSSGASTRITSAQEYDPALFAHYRKTHEVLQEHGHRPSPSASSAPISDADPSLYGGSDVRSSAVQHQDGRVGIVQELPSSYRAQSLRHDSEVMVIPVPKVP